MAYFVNVKREALAAMVMTALETFLLPMKNRERNKDPEEAKGHEVFGYIFGTRDKCKQGYEYTVDFINFDITARTFKDEVRYHAYGIELKKAIAKIALPKIKLLGNFHTHPCRILKDDDETFTGICGSGIWMPSPGDIKEEDAQDLQLDIIMAVTNACRSLIKGTCHVNSNCIQFNLDNIRFYLAAYVRRNDDESSFPPYVDFSEVKLKKPEGLWRLPKKLCVDEYIKEEYFKI